MKRKIFLATSLLLILCLSGCSSSTNNNSTPDITTGGVKEDEATVVEESVAEPKDAVNEEESEKSVVEKTEKIEEEPEKTQEETYSDEEYVYSKIAKQYMDIITPLNSDEYYFNLVYVRDTEYPQLAIGIQEDGMILYEQQIQLYFADEEGNVQRIADFGEIMDSDGPAWYYERQDIVVLFFSYYGDDDFVNEWHVCRSDGSEITITQSEDEFKQYEQGLQKHFSEDIYTKEEILAYLNNMASCSENNKNENEEL